MSNINTGMLNTKYQIPNTVLKGFTLIEAMVSLFIFSIITMAFYQAWFLATDHIVNVKNRLGATALANEQMEIVRSLVFDDIGTTTGVPVGIIAEYQTITKNTAVYTVHTVVRFVDDPQDGTAALATDIAPNDYKKITIEVSWGSSSPSEAVEVISNVSLDGVESVAAGTGVLSINILNNAGDGISGADVHIVNNDVSPNIDMTDDTDVLGNTTFPGAPESAQSYQISVSKTGYYGNTTYPPNPISSFNPLNVHSSVVAGSLTPVTLITDQISTIDFYTKDPFDVAIPNINFSISGGLMIGNDTESGDPVYDYSENTSTNGSGNKSLNNRSSGIYTIDLDAGETGYEYVRLLPLETTFSTLNLVAGTTTMVTMVLADKVFSSVLITAKNGADDMLIAGASVHLTDTVSGYDATVVADIYGQAYFPTTAVPLATGTYDVEITATGFTTETGTITITGSQINKKTFLLSDS